MPEWFRDMTWMQRMGTTFAVGEFAVGMWEVNRGSVWEAIVTLGATAVTATITERGREIRLYGPQGGEPNMEGIQEY